MVFDPVHSKSFALVWDFIAAIIVTHVLSCHPRAVTYAHALEMGFSFRSESHGNFMGMGTEICQKMGMGIAAYSCVPKFPSVDSMRMLANKIS